jgi:hypothetical protein
VKGIIVSITDRNSMRVRIARFFFASGSECQQGGENVREESHTFRHAALLTLSQTGVFTRSVHERHYQVIF